MSLEVALDFGIIKDAVAKKFKQMSGPELFETDYEREAIWETYLNSFPEGTNPMFRERSEHDCACCRSFIRRMGAVVKINEDGSLTSIWDVDIEGPYGVVAKAMSDYVKSRPIKNVFRNWERVAGQDKNVERNDLTGETLTWRHFFCETKEYFMKKDQTPTFMGDKRANFDVLKRSLAEMTLDSAEIVLDLIDQGSLYRGDEKRRTVETFIKLKKEYDAFVGDKDRYVWLKSIELGGASKIRNDVIGTLISDLSEGEDLETAVGKFEAKVAPHNYKRPTALITQKMIDNAQKTVVELGYETALQRRYAKVSDVTVNNVIYADRNVKPAMKGIFDELKDSVPDKPKNLDKVEEVSIGDFINKIVPKASKIELLVENKHASNFMSVLAPVDQESKNMFKWNNNFSWAYDGEVADGIKQHVKNAGGNVAGEFRCSLAWYSRNDLDLHMKEPDGNEIYYGNMHSRDRKGRLDVDNIPGGDRDNPAIENIYWTHKRDMKEGKYKVFVHNYSGSNTNEPGFDFEMEFMGQIHNASYPKAVPGGRNVTCIEFEYSHKDGIKIIDSLPLSTQSREIWGVNTEKFQTVSMVMNSPNHWDGNETGNKHWFFILEGCNSGQSARGFFNEFLKDELTEHRKVFEVLGSKLRAEASDEQLSGLGFSSTVRNHAHFRVSGTFNRTLKVRF
jgi:hypothetical protein